jgi:hypothetical protein
MKSEGLIKVENNKTLVKYVDTNSGVESWHPISECDMAHRYDAVKYWNICGRYLGPKHPAIREWMLTADNYFLEPRGPNRSKGAKLQMRYLPPVAE